MFFDRLGELDFSLVTAEEIYMMAIGYLVVFVVLASLFIVFQNMPRLIETVEKFLAFLIRRKDSFVVAAEKTIAKNGTNAEKKEADKKVVLSGEVNAAISAAIHMYVNESHDQEHTILTIDKVSRRYSPWSSKIYSVTNLRR
ncbi:MAG: OadG family protein [Gracilimonas sp.]